MLLFLAKKVSSITSLGDSYFRVHDITANLYPFTIQASAPSHSLFVQGISDNIGLGNSTPEVELHIIDGYISALRFEQDGSSYHTPQIWDLAGDETNFFIQDVTNSNLLPTTGVGLQNSHNLFNTIKILFNQSTISEKNYFMVGKKSNDK